MDAWQEEGFPDADFLADDGVHHNDRGYACLAERSRPRSSTGSPPTQAQKSSQSASAR